MLGIWTAEPHAAKQIGLVRAGVHTFVVEHLADLNAAIAQLRSGGLKVGNDQVQTLGGTGPLCGDVPAEDDRATGARWRELDYAEVVFVGEVGVEPPSELRVELLRPIHIRNGQNDNLELHVNWCWLRCVFSDLLVDLFRGNW